ncbi:adenosylmethionine--8-amino-7-oxononanoate transaminase [Ornithinimicrobium tianjinense]|uniref:Adenosylmethionine-8-amino-7-oxononanoate aminotransferase n=1 Tax=Ornithinimicrobium tianjinense TaxID=1195761 RepID=A0A917BHC9_9MICO|nr:adenosylmethionine--8-amino-7-oxononanoate transaminase [Ornithinimicrobium tianjinense]GGF41138.1 adenosylmethionine-8-amino-7-oxononanoate aminotransferase [Ornithinimicrobium tianjinense]
MSLLERDRGLLWHPYAPVDAGALYAVRAASGVRLTLDDGATEREVVDGMASWWSAVHGYRHPVLDAAARAQLDRFSHVMFGGLTHEPAVELAERLVTLAPAGLEHVFLADSGSISVEVALKIVLQHHAARGRPERSRFLALRGGYHGDTFATMSVCDPVDGMHAAFSGMTADHVFAPRPPAARLLADGSWQVDEDDQAAWERHTRDVVAAHARELAGIVAEPVLQGAGGMHVYHPRCLTVLRELADEHDLLLVLDEIATGLGRTGRFLATEHAGVVPDLLCVGKALTGGYLTLAAVLCSARVAEVVGSGGHGMPRALLHGPTFMGNPLACAVAASSLGLLTADGGDGPAWRAQVAGLQGHLQAGLQPASDLTSVRDVRVLGGVGVVQLDGPVRVAEVTRAVVRRGAWVRPFRDLVYVMPPYVCGAADVAELTAAVVGGVEEVHG